MSPIKIEVCANSLESALNAQKGGAHRVELCSNLYEGGTTPSMGELSFARELLNIQVNVLIRPRGGDFVYSENEIEIIKRDVLNCKNIGVDGVVIGFLNADGGIDKKLTQEITDLARPMSVTFHRAFDMCKNPEKSLLDLIEIGVDRILTSGAENKAIDGVELLRKLVDQAGENIIIMPGSGIRANNILEIIKQTGAKEFHVSERKSHESPMQFRRGNVFMGGLPQIPEYEIRVIDAEMIRLIVDSVLEHG
jgi:copper homeostasis protein